MAEALGEIARTMQDKQLVTGDMKMVMGGKRVGGLREGGLKEGWVGVGQIRGETREFVREGAQDTVTIGKVDTHTGESMTLTGGNTTLAVDNTTLTGANAVCITAVERDPESTHDTSRTNS